jgi:hypothetical protein
MSLGIHSHKILIIYILTNCHFIHLYSTSMSAGVNLLNVNERFPIDKHIRRRHLEYNCMNEVIKKRKKKMYWCFICTRISTANEFIYSCICLLYYIIYGRDFMFQTCSYNVYILCQLYIVLYTVLY